MPYDLGFQRERGKRAKRTPDPGRDGSTKIGPVRVRIRNIPCRLGNCHFWWVVFLTSRRGPGTCVASGGS